MKGRIRFIKRTLQTLVAMTARDKMKLCFLILEEERKSPHPFSWRGKAAQHQETL
jgi:hypothetical protein